MNLDRCRALDLGLPWVLPGILLALWFLASGTGSVPEYLLPSPGSVLRTATVYMLGEPGSGPYAGRFLGDLRASLGRVMAGFGLAVALGVPLGALWGRLPLVRLGLTHVVNGLRAVPGIAWLPLALVWLGIGFKTTVFLVALAAFFPITLNTAAGVRQVDPLLLRAGAMLGLGRVRMVFGVLLPAAMSHIRAGLRLGLGIAFAYLVLGELTGVPDGLGAVIMDARMVGRVDMIVVGILCVAVVGRVCDRLLVLGLGAVLKSARRMS